MSLYDFYDVVKGIREVLSQAKEMTSQLSRIAGALETFNKAVLTDGRYPLVNIKIEK